MIVPSNMFLPSFLALRKAASDGNLEMLKENQLTLTPEQIEILMVCAISSKQQATTEYIRENLHKGHFTEPCRIAFATIGDLDAIITEKFYFKSSLKDNLHLLKVACEHQQWHILTEWWIGTHLRKYKHNDMHCSTILKTICEKCPSNILQAFILHESFQWPEGALKILIETNRLAEAITQLSTVTIPIWAKFQNVTVDSVVALASRIRLTIDIGWFLENKHYEFVLDLTERFNINMTAPFDEAIEVCKGLHLEFSSRNFHPIRYMTALQNSLDTFEARRITEICNKIPSQKELQQTRIAIRMIRTATHTWQWQFDAREWILFLLTYFYLYKRTQEETYLTIDRARALLEYIKAHPAKTARRSSERPEPDCINAYKMGLLPEVLQLLCNGIFKVEHYLTCNEVDKMVVIAREMGCTIEWKHVFLVKLPSIHMVQFFMDFFNIDTATQPLKNVDWSTCDFVTCSHRIMCFSELGMKIDLDALVQKMNNFIKHIKKPIDLSNRNFRAVLHQLDLETSHEELYCQLVETEKKVDAYVEVLSEFLDENICRYVLMDYMDEYF